jgi:glutamate synthase (NADPH/NADH)
LQTAIKQLALDTDPRSNIKTPANKYTSSRAKIFAAGDCRRGQSLVVWALHEGRQAARHIDHALMGKTSLAGPGGLVLAPM